MVEIRRKLLNVFVVCFVFVGTSLAQQTTGVINGRVSDDSGAVIPGVQIVLTSPVVQGERTTLSDEAGSYRFLLLPPGVYKVAYELAGFQKLIREGVIVEVTKT